MKSTVCLLLVVLLVISTGTMALANPVDKVNVLKDNDSSFMLKEKVVALGPFDWITDVFTGAKKWLKNASKDTQEWLKDASDDTMKWLEGASEDTFKWLRTANKDTMKWLEVAIKDIDKFYKDFSKGLKRI